MGKERKRLKGANGRLKGSEKFNFDNDYYIKNNVVFIKVQYKDSTKLCEVDLDFLEILKSLNYRLMCDARGYCYITLSKNNIYNLPNNRGLFIHNLVVLGIEYYTKNMSNEILVDHIDTNILNNKRNNLRITTKSENPKNANIRKDNSSGIKGVRISKNRNKLKINARIQNENVRISRTFPFSTQGLIECINWIYEKRNTLHKEFSNHGSKYINMSEEEIKEDMVKTFIENIPTEYINVFYKNIK